MDLAPQPLPDPIVPPRVHRGSRPDSVAVLTLDDPGAAHNAITPSWADELWKAIEAAQADPRISAIVLVSGKKDSFVVGADLDRIRSVRFATDAEDAALAVADRFGRIANANKPVVACVHGAALGGGFELAIACSAIVATADPKTELGLPEVKLGLLPASNGLLRIAERAGLLAAIDLGLEGRSLRPTDALAMGLVDEVVAPTVALEAAVQRALALATRTAGRVPMRAGSSARRNAHRHGLARLERASLWLLESNAVGRAMILRRARAEAERKTSGHYPAVTRILDVLQRWSRRGFAAAAALEAQLFGELVVSETSHRLVELFYAARALKKDDGLEPSERHGASRAHAVERIQVVGAGLMGAGIATVSARAGIEVRMKDTRDLPLGRGLKYVKHVLDEQTRRGSLSPLDRDRAFARLSGTTDYAGIHVADLVIEAVFEDLALKQGILRDVEARVKETCVLASNTSSISIAKIAEAAERPERVLGMHYFGPVERTPLLEIVRTKATARAAIETAVAVGKKQGKTVLVVHDGVGFYTTRILVPYLNEAIQLLTEGAPIELVDRALVDWGFPQGPLHLLDELGIDVAAHAAGALHHAFGERLRAPKALAALSADDRRGRKNGRGFYLYGRGPRAERRVDDTVFHALGQDSRRPTSREEIALRCTLGLVNEALRCLDEGILRSPRDGDVGAILGLGFPPFRGGPFRYVDVLGAPEVLRRTRALEQRHGPRFEPAPLLVSMARSAKRFYA